MPHSPVTLVIFGATGDLAVKKIFPAIDRLYASGDLHPDTRIIATSRREWNNEAFRAFLIDANVPSAHVASRISYVTADFDAKRGYDDLKSAIEREGDKERIVYLSLAPIFFEDVISDLKREQILVRGSGKLLLEKPFGTDARSAEKLTELLHSFLDPAQVYRIDHYLGKSALRALIKTHEESTGLRTLLSNDTVAGVAVELFETKGLDGRASYDKVGAFRDVGQNHMLEMLAVTFAEYPPHATPTMWQDARAAVIEALALPRRGRTAVRVGQYADYRIERGVDADSQTETAFEINTMFTGGELHGIPVTLRAGKRMPRNYAGITITFKEIAGIPRTLILELQPEPRAILTYETEAEVIPLQNGRDAYEHVIKDVIDGELRRFVGARETHAAWRYTDRLMHCLRNTPIEPYGEGQPFL